MAFDPLQETLDLLSTNWTAANTDSITPNFQKITDFKRWDYNANQDVIFAQRPIENTEPVGVGDADKHEFNNFNLDIRVRDTATDQEGHWYKVLDEVKRILKANKILPFSSELGTEAHVLEWNGTGPDLSDKTHKIWRKLIPIQLLRYNVSR